MPLTIQHIEQALALSSDGERSDFDLNPEIRSRQLQDHTQRPAAVLCGLRERGGVLHVVLTHRAAHLNQHAGQVAFPGGKVDPTDLSAHHTALREAHEEIGLAPSSVRVLGTLDEYFTSTGFRVTPVVGIIEPEWVAAPDANEVDSVFEPPLDFLVDPANRVRHHHDRLGYRRYYYAMPWNGNYIWGATAGMIKGLADRIHALGESG